MGQNGEGKEITLSLANLATYKQAPYLIRELVRIMPKLKMRTDEKDEDFPILKREIKKNKVKAKFFTNSIPTNIYLMIDYSNQIIVSYDDLEDIELNFPIDPLKFEKRKLLNKDEVKDLKEKYKIRENEKVIVGGSFHKSDFRGIESILYEQKNKFVLVPRDEEEFSFWDNNLEVPYETDEKIKGNKKNLIVFEKGTLDDLYSVGDIALLGDTFGKPNHSSWKGQNPLEPAFYGKRIISGCKYGLWNREAFHGLRESGLLKVISDVDEIKKEINTDWPKERLNESQEKAQKFIGSQQGIGKAYAKIVQKVLYNDLTNQEKDFLSSKQSYDSIKKMFS